MTFELTVEGHPVPKGSLMRNAFGALYFPPAERKWEMEVRRAARQKMRREGYPLIEARCRVGLRFFIKPTKNGRLIGDLDKLVRAVLDAISGVVIKDDEWVVGIIANKQPIGPGQVEHVHLTVTIANPESFGDDDECDAGDEADEGGLDEDDDEIDEDEIDDDVSSAARTRRKRGK